MPRSFVFVPLVALVLLIAAACGGGGGSGGSGGNSSGGAAPSPSVTAAGAPLSDLAYLKTFCTGLTNYQEALVSAKDAQSIGNVIREFSGSMKAVNPPEDLREFHTQFVAYLDAALADPTSLVASAPPLPPESVRARLAGKVKDVPECKYPTFLREPR